jgi:hypothetical protein
MIVAIAVGPDIPATWPTVSLAAIGPAVIFDPTQPYIPLGVLAPGDQGGYGLLVDAQRAELFKFPTPSPQTPTSIRTVACSIDAEGGLRVHLTDDELGLLAGVNYGQRARITKEEYAKGVDRHVDRLTPSATVENWTEAWDPVVPRFRVDVYYSAPGFHALRGNGMLMVAPTAFFDAPRLPSWGTQAIGTVFLLPENQREEIELSPPDGCRVEEIPDAFEQDFGGTLVSAKYTQTGQAVRCVLVLVRRGGFYPRADYDRLREAVREFTELAKRPVIFMRAPVPAK